MSARKQINSEEIRKLFNEGFNSVEISKKLDVSPVSIRYHYNKLGLKAQSPQESSRKYEINHDYFSDIDNQDKAYILGLLYADGCNFISKKEVKVILELVDDDIIYKINNLIQPDKPISIKTRKHIFQDGKKVNTQPTYRICFQSRKISSDLILLGVIPNKSLNLIFPSISDELISHFIRGYFDGDGGISDKNTSGLRVNFIGNVSFLEKIQDILYDNLKISRTKMLKNSKSNAVNFTFSSGKDVIKFREWIYNDANLYIQRKKSKIYGKLQDNI